MVPVIASWIATGPLLLIRKGWAWKAAGVSLAVQLVFAIILPFVGGPAALLPVFLDSVLSALTALHLILVRPSSNQPGAFAGSTLGAWRLFLIVVFMLALVAALAGLALFVWLVSNGR
jgi:hypothetical protein